MGKQEEKDDDGDEETKEMTARNRRNRTGLRDLFTYGGGCGGLRVGEGGKEGCMCGRGEVGVRWVSWVWYVPVD